MQTTDQAESRAHVWIARLGVLAIAVVAFLFVYDAGVTFAAAVGYRSELDHLWPWLIEGFLALVVYTGGLIRQRGGDVTYPACLFGALLTVSGYMNVRVHTHHGPTLLALSPVEAGAASALPVLILASSVHLLLRTFERPKLAAVATDGVVTEPAAYSDQTGNSDTQPPAVPEPDAFTLTELVQLPEQPAPPALRGVSNFRTLAAGATTPAARKFYQDQVDKLGGKTAQFGVQGVLC